MKWRRFIPHIFVFWRPGVRRVELCPASLPHAGRESVARSRGLPHAQLLRVGDALVLRFAFRCRRARGPHSHVGLEGLAGGARARLRHLRRASNVAAFARTERPGHRRWRGPSPGRAAGDFQSLLAHHPGAVGSGKTSACMHPFARQLLSWQAANPQMRPAALGIDFYLWLTYRTFTLKCPLRLSWARLYRQFGVDPAKAGDKRTADDFRKDCLRELKKIQIAWPGLNYATAHGALILQHSKPAVPPARRQFVEVALKPPSLTQNRLWRIQEDPGPPPRGRGGVFQDETPRHSYS